MPNRGPGDISGFSAAGDVDDDGYADVLVGALYANTTNSTGQLGYRNGQRLSFSRNSRLNAVLSRRKGDCHLELRLFCRR